MSAADRREAVLRSATAAFARTGYAGTSTDVVAREAGVSQPYVVRIFGGKLPLFLEVFGRACDRIADAFAAVLADGPFDPESEADGLRLAEAYKALLEDRDLLRVTMHGFTASDDPEIAAAARAGLDRVFAVVKRTGWADEQVEEFVSHGMLINVLLLIRAPEHRGERAGIDALSRCALDKLRVDAAEGW